MPKRAKPGVKRYASEFARLGGDARAKKLDPERRVEIAKKAAQARWEKAKKR
jgi:general stress protein YciG